MSANASPALQVTNLAWQHHGRAILRDVSFALGRGEIVGLLGPNGSGKSSVLRALLGLVRPDAGQLHLAGKRLPFGARALRQAAGVVFQGQSLDDKLTVQHNLTLGAALFGLRGAAAQQRITEALALVELSDRANDRCAWLSGGMRRRLELARALLPSPQLLLLDEPTQGLDPLAQRRLWQRLEAARQAAGLSILLSTHDAEEAARCSRIVVLDGGRVVAADTPAALLARAGGDVLAIQPAHDVAAEAVADDVRRRLQLDSRQEDGQVLVQQHDGHLWVPRLVDAVGASRIRGIALRRPTLADAFYHLVGSPLTVAGEAKLAGAGGRTAGQAKRRAAAARADAGQKGQP